MNKIKVCKLSHIPADNNVKNDIKVQMNNCKLPLEQIAKKNNDFAKKCKLP